MSDKNSHSFQPIHNPYIVGNPIKDRKMFFGREDDFEFIRTKVTGGKTGGFLVLCGSRRSGKTSILFQILDGRLGEEFVPVLIDMQAMTVENDLDFLIKLAQGITDAVKDPGVSLEADFLGRRDQSKLAAFQHFITKVSSRLNGRKIILLFDEYEIFESHIAKKLISTEVLDLFASWLDHVEGLFLVFTGSDRIEDRGEDYWRLMPRGLFRKISFLTRDDTLRLINEPLKDVITYENGVPDRIYALTAGQPFYTQVYCQALVDNLNERQDYAVTSDDLDHVTEQIIENPLPQMIFSWNSMTNMEKLTLSITAELSKKSTEPIGAKDVTAFAKNEKIGFDIDTNLLNETLEKLFHSDMLIKVEDAYTFKMDLWRRWIARMHSIWQTIDEIKGAEGGLGPGITPKRRKPVVAMAIGGITVLVLAGSGIAYNEFVLKPRRNTDLRQVFVVPDSTWVTVRTVPEGAEVFLDQRRLPGRTPIDSVRVDAAASVLRVELGGYRDAEHTLELAKDVPFDTTITLVEETGNVTVTSQPPGADILLDGERTGHKTPHTFENLSVNRQLRFGIRLEGYQVRTREVTPEADSTIPCDFRLDVSTYQVTIRSVPTAADLYIDGETIGETPQVVQLEYGRHRVVLEKRPLYRRKEVVLDVPGAGRRIEYTLDRLPQGTVAVSVTPYAQIYIDGLSVKTGSNYIGQLDPGRHTIRLVHQSFGEVSGDIWVAPDSTTNYRHNFSNSGSQ